MNKKNIYSTVLFFIALFLFDRFFFFSFQELEKNLYKHQSFRKIFMKFPYGTYNALIMGSSRTYKGIHSALLYKSLGMKAKKIAKASKSFEFNYKFYVKYREISNKPKILIYGLDYFMFKMESDPIWMRYFLDSKKKYSLVDKGFLRLISNKRSIDSLINTSLNNFNNFFFREKKINKSFEKIVNIKKRGKFIRVKIVPDYMDKFVGFSSSRILNSNKKNKFKKMKYVKYPGKEGFYFNKLLDVLKKDGVQVVLVYLPDTLGTYETTFQRKTFIKDIAELTKKYSNVSIYNYNKPEVFPLHKPENFLDGGYGKENSHLSKKGSALLNKALSNDLRKHLIKEIK